MGYYGPLETFKITYYPPMPNGGIMGVAFVEADCRRQALYTFSQQYAGQYTTVYKCEKLFNK